MRTKTIGSTEAQNNFGRVLDSAIQDNIAYVIERRGTAQAVIIALSDLRTLLMDSEESKDLGLTIRELGPKYDLGETVDGD